MDRLIQPNSLIRGKSLVVRFDTVVFNLETRTLEVWRYYTGRYLGEHVVVLSMSNITFIDDIQQFEKVVWLIAGVAGLLGISREYELPHPWQGYRFV